MKKSIKRKWVKALRSGEWLQGRRKLASKGKGFCCLGVLCELAREEGIVDVKKLPDGSFNYSCFENLEDGSPNYLPGVVQDWAGLAKTNPQVKGGHHLSSMNDSGTSFDRIADEIEKGL